jgi:hypothetical protein
VLLAGCVRRCTEFGRDPQPWSDRPSGQHVGSPKQIQEGCLLRAAYPPDNGTRLYRPGRLDD